MIVNEHESESACAHRPVHKHCGINTDLRKGAGQIADRFIIPGM